MLDFKPKYQGCVHHINFHFNILLHFVSGPTTGSNCVRSCVGLRNGNYQSCLGCDVFVICKKSFLRDNNPCPLYNETDKTYWDDIKRECTTEKSKTCIVHDVEEAGNLL